jgi:ribosome biogenesis GTPase A
MKQIHWYPGHMAKTKREIKERLRVIDIVVELRDARAPYSSKNPLIETLTKHKPRMLILNKADLAIKEELVKWQAHYQAKGIPTILLDSLRPNTLKKLLPEIEKVAEPYRQKELARGRINRPIRMMILGIPNVGKSTLINALANKSKLKVKDMPGVTKHLQYIRVNKDLELLDTPGILWPKFEEPEVAKKLALLGAIKDDILPLDDVTIYGFQYLDRYHSEVFKERYEMDYDIDDVLTIYDGIAKKRGAFLRGKETDYDRVNQLFLHDFRNQKFGDVMLDRVDADV